MYPAQPPANSVANDRCRAREVRASNVYQYRQLALSDYPQKQRKEGESTRSIHERLHAARIESRSKNRIMTQMSDSRLIATIRTNPPR